ncbi:MAG TPA: STN domain-containing protein, partial [Sphingopyxis sp.]|nr:STN domain-containing protein [Sphingopyxis sp.]
MAVASPAMAQSKSFNVPAQSALTGIPELARQADVQILVAESAARGRSIKPVRGTMTVDQALRRALSGTGLRVSSSDGRTFT